MRTDAGFYTGCLENGILILLSLICSHAVSRLCAFLDSGDITADKLAIHNSASDCWIALHGHVYDVTSVGAMCATEVSLALIRFLLLQLYDKLYEHIYFDDTQFLSKHPGGRAILLAAGGKDATANFDRIGRSPAH